jgi:agmatine deiminase
MRAARDRVGRTPNVVLHDVPTNDAWIRDHGPTFLASAPGSHLPPALLDWQYNAWGEKYPPFDADNRVPERVATITGRRRFSLDLVLEGGAIEGNGAGTLLSTRSCLLNPNRNPHWTAERVERILQDNLAVDTIVWLGGEIAGDDTDGHIDQIARFVGRNTILAATDSSAESSLSRNLVLLKDLGFDVVPLPLPPAKEFDGHKLPASYANFYVANEVVVVPAFDDPLDEHAAGLLREFFPDREVIQLAATWLVVGLGAFHCLSQQEPLPHLSPSVPA